MSLPPAPSSAELARLFAEAMLAPGEEGYRLRGRLCDEHGSLLSQSRKEALLARGAEHYTEPKLFAVSARWVWSRSARTHFIAPSES